MAACETCVNYIYDEDDQAYYCECPMDEDDVYRLMSSRTFECPFYRFDDEYGVVRHQM